MRRAAFSAALPGSHPGNSAEKRGRTVAAGVVGLLAAAVALVGLVPARADRPDATGWWSATQVGPVLPVAQPTVVPPGGLYVAGSAAGTTAVSAVRFVVPEGSDLDGDLVVPVERAAGAVTVEACLVVPVWAPEQGGRLDAAPPANCTAGRSAATVAAGPDGDVLRVPLGPVTVDGVVNLRLQPAPGSTAFQLVTKAPGDQAFTVTARPEPGEDAEEFESFEPPVFDPGSPSGFEPGPPLSFEPLAPAAPVAPAPTVAPRPPARPRVANPAGQGGDGGWLSEGRIRFIAALVAADLAALYLWLLRSPSRGPRLLGPFGGAAPAAVATSVRGIGRFARTRSAPPVRL